MRHAAWISGVGLALMAGCAPTTMSPMGIRLAPGAPDHVTKRTGLRTGPRLSAPLQAPDDFEGNSKPFASPQWSVAYDADVLIPVSGGTSVHLGFQGEIGCDEDIDTCPLPVPGYGLSMGLSHYLDLGEFSLAPAVVLRGATDFGLGTEGGPGSVVGAEASVSLSLKLDETSAVGLVPFLGVHRVMLGDRDISATYTGVALAGHFDVGNGQFLELTAGGGVVKMRGVPDWWAPIFGIRGGP